MKSLSKKELAEFAGVQVVKAVEECVASGKQKPWHVPLVLKGIDAFDIHVMVSIEYLKKVETTDDESIVPF